MMQHALAPQMNTQFTVTYQRKNGEIAQQAYYVDSAEAARVAFLKYVFGMTEANIISIVDSTPQDAPRQSANRTVGSRTHLNLFDEKQARLVEIFSSDPRFRMPISSPPEQEDAVVDEISHAEEGLTVASDRKSFVSYDTVFSTSEEVSILLAGSGAYAAPYFDSKEISLLHGCRKEFYLMLIKHGLTPSLLSESVKG